MARMRYGVHPALEREADRLIRESLKDVKRPSDNDVMTDWKKAHRRRREIMVPSGTPDPAIRQGMANRAVNRARPDLNARDGIARSSSRSTGGADSLSDFAHGGGNYYDGGRPELGEMLGEGGS